MTKDHKQLWDECLAIIRDIVSPEQYDSWFAPITSVSFEDGKLTLRVPSHYFTEHLEGHYLKLMVPTLRRVYGEGIKLFYTYNQVSEQPETKVTLGGNLPSPAIPAVAPPAANPFDTPVVEQFDSQLNPRYTFENYCGSKSNKIALAIAESVANDPKCKTFNPMFVFGPSGVGKTHLVQAMGIRIKERFPKIRVLYMTARLFESQYTYAVSVNKLNDFIFFYQSIDVLILDDIQDLMGKKPGTQNAFFHIFNHLHQNSKQIILTSDVCPSQMGGLEERMLSRFKWGITAELERPDIELRRDVLHLKAQQDGLELPADVMEFIATNVSSSVRELEGIVVSLMAHATVLGQDVTLDLARNVLSNYVKLSRKSVNFEMITQEVCNYFKVDVESIYTKVRTRDISDARQMVMYLAKKHVKMPLAAIGTRLARSHATVLHGCKNIEERLSIEKSLQKAVDAIELNLR